MACDECEPLLRQARDELHIARGLVAHARNRTKLETAALSDSLARMEALSSELDRHLNPIPKPEGGPGNGKAVLTQSRQ